MEKKHLCSPYAHVGISRVATPCRKEMTAKSYVVMGLVQEFYTHIFKKKSPAKVPLDNKTFAENPTLPFLYGAQTKKCGAAQTISVRETALFPKPCRTNDSFRNWP